MSELVEVTKRNYEPSFNEETGEYFDECPYRPYSRNQCRYECNCKAGTGFTGRQAYNVHIKNKTHQAWLKDYNNTRKEVNDLKRENIRLRGEQERHALKIRQFVAYKTQITKLLTEKDRIILKLQNKIEQYENFDDAEVNELLEEFQDCLNDN
jgi:hypothetical protein